MLILGIETSCDDTSVAIVQIENDVPTVLANVVSSQTKTHTPYGGVVPMLAAREHEKNLPIVLDQALKVSGVRVEGVDMIAVTSGPGLIMSLVKGVNFAKKLAQENHKPLVGVNHIEGHIYSNWIQPVEAKSYKLKAISFPALCLIVSGGHTELVLMRDHGSYELIGRTKDDASGEAFDKIARILGLEYPGGPAISREAEKIKNSSEKFKLPRPMLHTKDFDFSFSGLKTAVLYMVRDLKVPLEDVRTEIAYEAQEAIVDVLISKTRKAVEKFQPASILLAGGVSANKRLRQLLTDYGASCDIPIYIPPMEYTTDNAAMIAMAAYFNHDNKNFEADANWEIV